MGWKVSRFKGFKLGKFKSWNIKMATIKQFEDLDIWKEAIEVAAKVYKLTNTDSIKNDWSMKDQIRRSAISISSNIAEGFEYNNNKQFVRFLGYSKGSAGELRSQLYLLKKVNSINQGDFNDLSESIIALSKKLMSFIKYLKS